MPFKYNPPTRTNCEICEKLNESELKSVLGSLNGKASAASSFPFHNWYYFVLGYTPNFPEYIMKRENITSNQTIVDPFMGSGTTLICAKNKAIKSAGVEANPFFKFASDTKLNWKLKPTSLRNRHRVLVKEIQKEFSKFNWIQYKGQTTLHPEKSNKKNPVEYAKKNRPSLLLKKYMCDNIFVKSDIIRNVLDKQKFRSEVEKNFFHLGLASIIVTISNIRYGPGFGVIKPREDTDVLAIFNKKIERMISDLESIESKKTIETQATTILGDSRLLTKYFDKNSVDFMITSPPYPGDHEYTKHSKLELVFMKIAMDLEEFRSIKKRMLRGSTTNIYKEDNEGEKIRDIKEIENIITEIDKRLKEDGATSGFEKLYTKLIREYFGGMYNVFKEAYAVMKPSAKFSLLVSDSHAFKMVHIKTAELLQKVAEKAGFVNTHIEVWQFKKTTSHSYKLLEKILTLENLDNHINSMA